MLVLLALVFAFVLFVVSAVTAPPSPAPYPWTRWISWGLACWVAAEILRVAPPLWGTFGGH